MRAVIDWFRGTSEYVFLGSPNARRTLVLTPFSTAKTTSVKEVIISITEGMNLASLAPLGMPLFRRTSQLARFNPEPH